VLAAALLVLACADPWSVDGAPRVAPDEQYKTGGGFQYRVYVWRCHEGQRTLVYQGCSEYLGCDDPLIERAACDAGYTPKERELAQKEREPLGAAYRWP
jgi:hypothetical protein